MSASSERYGSLLLLHFQKLLDSLLSLVLTPSLPLHLLEDKVYIKLAQVSGQCRKLIGGVSAATVRS